MSAYRSPAEVPKEPKPHCRVSARAKATVIVGALVVDCVASCLLVWRLNPNDPTGIRLMLAVMMGAVVASVAAGAVLGLHALHHELVVHFERQEKKR